MDYRHLNDQTDTPPYPVPDINSRLSSLAAANMFTTLDLTHGFLQIPLTPESKDKTAFITEDTTAKSERMPFGLKGAPATFQKLMSIIFKDLKLAGIVNTYLDNIIIPSRDWAHMMNSLEQVLMVLTKANLTLKPSKCVFGARELDYLGFRISKQVIKPGRKVEAIAPFPPPRDAYELRRFLGLAGYFRRFIVKYAELADPLTRLTAKDVPYKWCTEQKTAFEELKQRLCADPVVQMYDPKSPVTELHTDASSHALSGILLQGPTSTDLHMVYAVSKKTTIPESKYHSSRLELLAMIWSLNRLRPLLLGISFTIRTDCQALVYLNLHKTTKPQIARWYDVLQEFDFVIRYRPGSRMGHVDALSRVVLVEDEPRFVDVEISERIDVFTAMTKQEAVRIMQATDPHVRSLIETQKNNPRRSNSLSEYEVIDDILYKQYNGRPLLVVPKCMRKGVVIEAHDYGGHFSVDRTVAHIVADYWFAGKRRYVKHHISMCVDCLVHKKPAGRRPGELHPIPPGVRPFQVIHIDHLGPFEITPSKNQYLLVVIDNLTKYVQLYPCRSTNTAAVLRSMEKFCAERGIPDRIISDRGTCFTAHAFEAFCQKNGIRHTLNSTRHPQANGQVERTNRTIVPILSVSAKNHNDWDSHLRHIENMLNTAPNKSITKTPFETLHGYLP